MQTLHVAQLITIKTHYKIGKCPFLRKEVGGVGIFQFLPCNATECAVVRLHVVGPSVHPSVCDV